MGEVDRGDVHDDDQTSNHSIFTNVFNILSKHVEWALEFSHWRTECHGIGDSLQFQTVFIYKF